MATIWSCDDYKIEKVSSNTLATDSTNIAYVVELQKLPADQSPDITHISIAGGVIPHDTAKDALLNLIIPQCNTELANMDAANNADSFNYNSPKYSEITGL